MRELFIYYRVASCDAGPALAAVASMQRQLCSLHPGLQARLMQRPETKDGQRTWMEIYTHASPGGVSAELEAEIARAAQALAPLLAGPRRTEVFEGLTPCA